MVRNFFITLIVIISSGCGTIASNGLTPYSGVRFDIRVVDLAIFPTSRVKVTKKAMVWAILDLPFSAAFDTLILPCTLCNWLDYHLMN